MEKAEVYKKIYKKKKKMESHNCENHYGKLI